MTNKKKYLQQQNEKYPKDCFGNKQWKLASENSVISCNTKSNWDESSTAQCIKGENGPLTNVAVLSFEVASDWKIFAKLTFLFRLERLLKPSKFHLLVKQSSSQS